MLKHITFSILTLAMLGRTAAGQVVNPADKQQPQGEGTPDSHPRTWEMPPVTDYGRITGNPTIYVEWKGKHDAPDHFEGKLLLGGHIVSGWHWGSNLVWEHELGGPQENSNEWTSGVSHTIRDTKLGLGVETQVA